MLGLLMHLATVSGGVMFGKLSACTPTVFDGNGPMTFVHN